jgi:hypothetical protein
MTTVDPVQALKDTGAVDVALFLAPARDPDQPWLVYGAGSAVDVSQFDAEVIQRWRNEGVLSSSSGVTPPTPPAPPQTFITGNMELKPAPDVVPYPVESSEGFKVGDTVFVEHHGYLKVTLIDSPYYLDLVNLENPNNAAVGTVAPPGSAVRVESPP